MSLSMVCSQFGVAADQVCGREGEMEERSEGGRKGGREGGKEGGNKVVGGQSW